MTLMVTHSGINDLENASSKESSSEGEVSFYKFDMVNEVRNLTYDKLYDAIKIHSRSLCKIRNKYLDLKQVKIDLEK